VCGLGGQWRLKIVETGRAPRLYGGGGDVAGRYAERGFFYRANGAFIFLSLFIGICFLSVFRNL